MESKRIMTTLVANTIRDIVNWSNEKDIKKEDIVALVTRGENLILIYYKDNN